MTTQIEIRAFDGNKAVEIEIINMTSAGPTTERTITLRPGQTSEAITMHGPRVVSVREVGDFLDKPADPPAPSPVTNGQSAVAPLKATAEKVKA